MNLFLTDFHVFLAILAPNHRICAIIPRFRNLTWLQNVLFILNGILGGTLDLA